MKAVAYYRTSSAANVGEDKDSRKRQEDAVWTYASSHGLEIVQEFYDAAVRGADPVSSRPGFLNMLKYIADNNIGIIIVENAGRFARDLVVQITGYEYLKKLNISIIPADCPNHFLEDTPTGKLIRNVLGAVSEFQKDSGNFVMRLARERKRAETGRCEGRKPAEPGAIQLAVKLRAAGMTLREIGLELNRAGYRVRQKNKDGVLVTTAIVYKPQSIKAMLTKVVTSPIINEGVKYEGRP